MTILIDADSPCPVKDKTISNFSRFTVLGGR